MLMGNDENSRIRIQDPDPLVRSMDPRIRIRINPKMSWIRNTVICGSLAPRDPDPYSQCGSGSSREKRMLIRIRIQNTDFYQNQNINKKLKYNCYRFSTKKQFLTGILEHFSLLPQCWQCWSTGGPVTRLYLTFFPLSWGRIWPSRWNHMDSHPVHCTQINRRFAQNCVYYIILLWSSFHMFTKYTNCGFLKIMMNLYAGDAMQNLRISEDIVF
jgi:hypothetical protein